MGYKFYIMSLLENKTKDLKSFYDFQKKSIKETHKNLSKELYNFEQIIKNKTQIIFL